MMEKPISHTVHLQCPLCQLHTFETVTQLFRKEQTSDATKAHNTVTNIYIQQLTLVRQIVVHSSLTLPWQQPWHRNVFTNLLQATYKHQIAPQSYHSQSCRTNMLVILNTTQEPNWMQIFMNTNNPIA
jgi:hypothetical protein